MSTEYRVGGPNSGGNYSCFMIWMITDDQQRRSGIMNRQESPGDIIIMILPEKPNSSVIDLPGTYIQLLIGTYLTSNKRSSRPCTPVTSVDLGCMDYY